MNVIAKIVADGISSILGLTEQDAYRIVEQARSDQKRKIKAALMSAYSCEWVSPTVVISVAAHYPGSDAEHESPLSELTIKAQAHYELTDYLYGIPVNICIAQGLPKARAVAILKRLVSSVANMPDGEWSKLSAELPSLITDDDDIPF